MTDKLGWTLIHFIWQGAVIGFAYAVVRSLLPDSAAQKRYVLGCVALALMLFTPVLTFVIAGHASSFQRSAKEADANSTARGSASAPDRVPGAFEARDPRLLYGRGDSTGQLLRAVVLLWMLGAGFCILRLVAGCAGAIRVRRHGVSPVHSEWQQQLRVLGARLGMSRRVQLLKSTVVRAPSVIGWFRPVILVPASTLTGIPAAEFEALLMHELAHVRRHDYFVNILQSLAEALLFYHPAVWWISGHIRAEREHCCDDIAAAGVGDVLTYVRALANFESMRSAELAMSASGGSVRDRVARLLGYSRQPASAGSGGATVVVLILTVAAIGLMRAQTPARPNFEVVSVKQNPAFTGVMGGMGNASPGTFRATKMPLRFLIHYAYDVNSFNILNGPDWMDSAGFDIEAKTPVIPGETRREANARMLLMIQGVLEDRFRLKVHRETRDMPVYFLTVARAD